MENELSAGTSFNTGSCFALSSSIRRLVVAVAPRALYFLKYSILIHVVIIAYVLNPMGISIYLVPTVRYLVQGRQFHQHDVHFSIQIIIQWIWTSFK